MIDRAFFPDEATLREGLDETIVLVQNTADVAEAQGDFTADHRLESLTNPNPEQIDQLNNNYSLSDHSNQGWLPGYDDCDAWRNIFDDGWRAHYRVTADSHHLTDDDRRRILDAVREHWESVGYQVQTPATNLDDTNTLGLHAETELGAVSFWFDLRRGVMSVRGTTDCLPPQ